jgi:dCTP deaminase
MFLSGRAIHDEIESGKLVIVPFQSRKVRRASYVLSLGVRFRRWKRNTQEIKLWSENAAKDHLEEPFQANTLFIEPGEFLLACTFERVSIPTDKLGVLSPLSHVSRFGLGIHGGSDLVSPGFGGSVASHLTLELYNYGASSLQLEVQMPIAHLRVATVSGDADHCTPSIYEGADPVGPPAFYEEWSRILREPDA